VAGPLTPWAALTGAGQVRRLRALGIAALARYPLDPRRAAFVQRKVPAIFRVSGPAGQHVLRVYPPEQPVAALEEGLRWLRGLGEATDLLVPRPVAARDGRLVTTVSAPSVPSPQHCVVLDWVPGRTRDPPRTRSSELERVGALIAALHRHAARRPFAPAAIRPWDAERIIGTPSERRRLATLPWLSAPARSRLLAIGEAVDETLAALGQGPEVCGMIHADLHPANILWHDGRVGAIDFDDCGVGAYLLDLALALFDWADAGEDRRCADAILAGYARANPGGLRVPGTMPLDGVLETLIAARCLKVVVRWMGRTADLAAPPDRVKEMAGRLAAVRFRPRR
jgi:Ser/Thr protein kinase RdoA (MazF antagonist)